MLVTEIKIEDRKKVLTCNLRLKKRISKEERISFPKPKIKERKEEYAL